MALALLLNLKIQSMQQNSPSSFGFLLIKSQHIINIFYP
jgi:hypothetical protein